LVKDNPVAPQMYVRRRKKRHATGGAPPSPHDILETLQKLTAAAERFVNGVPQWKRMESERQALLDAITEAQLRLSVEGAGGNQARP
jgi:hypothetical protein